MTLSTRTDRRCATLRPGDAVGYGSRFVAQPTHAHRRRCLWLCGRLSAPRAGWHAGGPLPGTRVPMAGRVSMDMITVDLSEAPQAQVGSPVELWGSEVPIDEVATMPALSVMS